MTNLTDTDELRRLSACFPELNLSNYGPDDVEELNAWAIEVAQCIDRALAAPVQSVPAGWKMAPVTPTEEMLKAADDISTNRKRWGDMLAAAPAAISATPAEVQAEPVADGAGIHSTEWGPMPDAGTEADVLPQATKPADGEYLPLPMQYACVGQFPVYSAYQMHAYADAHRNTAPQAQPADALDAAFEAVRKRLCKIPRYSFHNDSRGNLRRVNESSGNWIEFEAAHVLFDPVAIDAMAGKDGE